MNIEQQLVAWARQIAVHRGYDNLVNGLQPTSVLIEKLDHERKEFEAALAAGEILHILHEVADLLYYSACLEEQKAYRLQTRNMPNPFPGYSYDQLLQEMRVTLKEYRITKAQMEAAAFAKYQYRVTGNKDEDEELRLIEQVIKQI